MLRHSAEFETYRSQLIDPGGLQAALVETALHGMERTQAPSAVHVISLMATAAALEDLARLAPAGRLTTPVLLGTVETIARHPELTPYFEPADEPERRARASLDFLRGRGFIERKQANYNHPNGRSRKRYRLQTTRSGRHWLTVHTSGETLPDGRN